MEIEKRNNINPYCSKMLKETIATSNSCETSKQIIL